MANEIPIVRIFAGCEELEYEPDARKGVTLRNVFHRIVRLPAEPFPCIREQMALYAMLTNGRGKHRISICLYFLHDGEEVTINKTPDKEIDLGKDPTVVHGLPAPHVKAIFELPGQYAFALLCDGQRIAEYPFEVV